MKFADLKKKTPAELTKELDETMLDQLRFNAKVATGGIGKESGKVRELRRKVARIKTLQRVVAKKTKK